MRFSKRVFVGLASIGMAIGSGALIASSQAINANAGSESKSITSFSAVSGSFDGDIVTYASYQGGSGTAPAVYNDGIRLYQAKAATAVGGYITLSASSGAEITSFSVTSSDEYSSTTIGYSVGDDAACGTDKTSLANSSTYTKSSLSASKVSFGCWGTSKSTRLEVASISVTYTIADHVVTALAVTPTSKTTDSNTALVEADYAVTITKDGAAGSSADYSVSVGTLTNGTYVKTLDVVWGTTKPSLGDNCLRFASKYPQTAGGDDKLNADVALTVNRPTLTGLTISETTATLNKGDTKALTVTATPTDGDTTVQWTTSNSSVATVGSSSGVVTAVENGEATITATSTVNNTITAICTVTVVPSVKHNLITNLNQLVPGAKVAFGGAKDSSYYVMSGTPASNNRPALGATVASNVMTPEAGYGEFTVGVGTKAGNTIYTFSDENGYLYAAGDGSNYLRSKTTLDDNGRWTVTLSGTAFTIVANGTNKNNTMQYNSTSTIFSCYTSASQKAVSLYILSSTPTDTAALFASDFVSSFLCDGGENTNVPSTSAWSAMGTRYAALSETDRNSLKDASANAAGTDLEKCAARYDAVLKAYGTTNYANFMSRSYTPQSSIFESNNGDPSALIFAMAGLALVGLAALSIVAVRRRHEN